MSHLAKKRLSRFLLRDIPLAGFLVMTLFPFYWILNTSLKDSVEVFQVPLAFRAHTGRVQRAVHQLGI